LAKSAGRKERRCGDDFEAKWREDLSVTPARTGPHHAPSTISALRLRHKIQRYRVDHGRHRHPLRSPSNNTPAMKTHPTIAIRPFFDIIAGDFQYSFQYPSGAPPTQPHTNHLSLPYTYLRLHHCHSRINPM